MSNRRSNFANAYETTLTAGVSGTDLTFNVSTTSGAPASPCYLVVDPDDPAKREYIYFDGTFTGTALVTTDLNNRHLTGSAASSGLTHDAGAVVRSVPTAQAFIDLHDRGSLHTHQGGDQGVQLDHGLALSGLADDDHSAYALVGHSFVTTAAESRLSGEKVLGADVVMAGLSTAIPSVGVAGRLYFETDTGILKRDTGSAWVKVGASDHGRLDGLADDDHTQYYNSARHTAAVHNSLALDHGSLSGRGDDDHTQYYNSTRHTAAVHNALGIDHGQLTGLGDPDHIASAGGVVFANNSDGALAKNLSATESTIISTTLTIPSTWASWRPLIIANLRVNNTATGGAAAASDRHLNLRTAAKTTTNYVDSEREHRLKAADDATLLTYMGGLIGTETGTGSQTFYLRGYLATNDNYHVPDASLSVIVFRVS